MSKLKIFIDAGHNDSGWNTGAVGNGLREQDITFEVSRILGDILSKQGIDVRLSRPTKQTNLGTNNTTSINTRWQMANQWGANFTISIHVNAAGGTGAETFYARNDALNFATVVQNTYAQEMGLRNRRTEKRTNLAVIVNTNHPSILVELAFIDSPLSNPDVNILKNKHQEMAQAIANGVFKHLNIVPILDNDEEEEEMRYNTIQEIPEWGRPTIQKLINQGLLNGNNGGLNLTEDMIRMFVINDRAGLYK